MNNLNPVYIFQSAFDTFKVFETIPMTISGILVEGHSKTIWQTLNHLIIWRTHQIQKLENLEAQFEFNESDSWIMNSKPKDFDDWRTKIKEFKGQTDSINKLISKLDPLDIKLNEKLKMIQDASTHLSFHLGEIILIARQKKEYPQPQEMVEFLRE